MDKINTDKFKNVTTDENTIVLYSQESKCGELDVLYEIWIFERVVKAQSLIFLKEDISHLQKADIVKMINEEMKHFDVKISDDETYVFANFGYQLLNEFTLKPLDSSKVKQCH